MTRRMTAWSTLLVCLVGAPAAPVLGVPITFMFSGQVAQIFDPTDLFEGAVDVGTPFSGSYTFESTTPDVDPQSRLGRYTGAIIDLVGEVGSVPFGGPSDSVNSIVIVDGTPTRERDSYELFTRVSLLTQTLPFFLTLDDHDSTVLLSDSLPMQPPELAEFETARVTIGSEVVLVLSGGITHLTPEPATLALVGIGGLAMTMRWRTRVRGKARRSR